VTETCEWCEHDTAVVVHEEYGDESLDDCDSANYTEYKCSTCGAHYISGTKFVRFTTYHTAGKPNLSVDVGPNAPKGE